MSVYFTSDTHLGAQRLAKVHREFDTVEQHDDTIIDRINAVVSKQSKLYIVGDIAGSRKGLTRLRDLNCRNIEIILGNHDLEPIKFYLDLGVKIHGFKKYKKYWVSHCPVHPNELYRCHGNIHGHVHRTGNSFPIEEKGYFNVNVDMNDYYPVAFDHIKASVKLEIEDRGKEEE